MSKPYSEADFSEQIAADRSWRLREISDLKSAILRADENLSRVLLRALITVCYAHWEGYVRFAARKYFDHIAIRKLQFTSLNRQFLRNYFLPRLASLSNSRTSIEERCALIDEILNANENRFSRINEELINTKANLSFDVLSDICLVCGIPISEFSDKSTFIDVVLLKRRNSIAHGEETLIAIGDLDEVTRETITLMRTFGDGLENHVYLKKYRSS